MFEYSGLQGDACMPGGSWTMFFSKVSMVLLQANVV